MPWKEVSIMSSRKEFVFLTRQEGANIRALCRGIHPDRARGGATRTPVRVHDWRGLRDSPLRHAVGRHCVRAGQQLQTAAGTLRSGLGYRRLSAVGIPVL